MNLKKMTALLLALVMGAAFCACASESATVGVIGGADGPTEIVAATDALTYDPEAIAVRIGEGDEHVITAGEVQMFYDNTLSQYAAYGIPAPTADADIETFQDQIITLLVEQQVLLYQADKLGHSELTAEQAAEAKQLAQGECDMMVEYYMQMVTEETEDEAALRAAAIERINTEMAAAGLDMDFDTYLVELEESYCMNYAIENLEAAIKAEATIEEADAKAYYDTLLAEHQAVTDDPLAYIDGQEAYETNGGEPMLVVPEGYVRVKVLTVEPQEALSAEYDPLLAEMEALEAEYGKLALTGENTARQSEIRSLYGEKKAAAEELWETYVKDARAAAEEAYAKLEGGEPFDTVFLAYGQDQSYAEIPAFGEKGRLLMPKMDEGVWDEAIREAAAALEVGEYSEIVAIDGSYHIVYLLSEEEAREIPYEEVQEVMYQLALEQRAATHWEEQQELWTEDTSLVTFFEENYRSIGKAA